MPAGSSFCSKCGAVVAGSEAEKQQVSEMQTMMKESSFMWVKFLLIIYAVPIIIVGIVNLINADANATATFNEILRVYGQKYIDDNHLTVDLLKSGFVAAGVMAVISGASAAASLIFVHMKKNWLLAFICCIVATITAVWSIIGIFVGIFVCWMVFDLKPYFDEEKAKAAQSQL